jgi:membrane-bound lytic murein transglycosylase D
MILAFFRASLLYGLIAAVGWAYAAQHPAGDGAGTFSLDLTASLAPASARHDVAGVRHHVSSFPLQLVEDTRPINDVPRLPVSLDPPIRTNTAPAAPVVPDNASVTSPLSVEHERAGVAGQSIQPESVTRSSALPPVASPAAKGAAPPEARDSSAMPEGQPPGSLWTRIRAGFAIPEIETAAVRRHEAWYLNRPAYMARMVERGRRYLFFVVEELEKRGMPTDLALLPMIESAYNPGAYSRAHAAGMWQFIPATGRRYGLEQNWWYDGRRDVMAATRAALDYLQKLYADFGDWHLALAAYNWGEGAVGRAVERNRRLQQPSGYLDLRMPAETSNYVPKLQAVKNIVADPARYGLSLEDVPNQPYFTRVALPAHMDVKRAAALAEMELEEFRSLNPAHNRPVITPAGGASVLLPVDRAEVFHANFESNDDPLVTWRVHTLRPRETLESLASRYGLAPTTLRQVNGISARGRLRAGQALLVPTPGASKAAEVDFAFATLSRQPAFIDAAPSFHKARRGETLQSIAADFGLSASDLARWNHLKGGKARPGQRIALAPPVPKHARGGHRSVHGKAAKQAPRSKLHEHPRRTGATRPQLAARN